MTCREKAEIAFKEEFAKIKDKVLLETVLTIFNNEVPDYFFTAPASSSGKYHPAISNGKGGLIRHTKLTVAVAEDLMQAFGIAEQDIKDCIIVACILHDILKFGQNADENGRSKENTTKTHGYAAYLVLLKYSLYECIRNAVAGHMGIWSCPEAMPHTFLVSQATVTEIVMLADYIASRDLDKIYRKLDIKYEELFDEARI